jgi:hypothetical protein
MKEKEFIDLSGCAIDGEAMKQFAKGMKSVLVELMAETADSSRVQTNAVGAMFKTLDYLENVEYI